MDEYSASTIWAEPVANGANQQPQTDVCMIEYLGEAMDDEDKGKWLEGRALLRQGPMATLESNQWS